MFFLLYLLSVILFISVYDATDCEISMKIFIHFYHMCVIMLLILPIYNIISIKPVEKWGKTRLNDVNCAYR